MRKMIDLMEAQDPLESSFNLRGNERAQSTAMAVHKLAETPIHAVDSAMQYMGAEAEFSHMQYNGFQNGYLQFKYVWKFKMWLEEFNLPVSGIVILECHMDRDTSKEVADIVDSSTNRIYFSVYSDSTGFSKHVNPTHSGLVYALTALSEEVDAEGTANKVMHALVAANKIDASSTVDFMDQGHGSAASTVQTTKGIEVYDISNIVSAVDEAEFNAGLALYKKQRRLRDNQVNVDVSNGTMTVSTTSSMTWD